MQRYDSGQLDDLLLDVKKMLGEDAPSTPKPSPRARRPEQHPQPVDDATRMFAPVKQTPSEPILQGGVYDGSGHYIWNDPSFTGEYYGDAAPTKSRAASPSAFDRQVEPIRRQASVKTTVHQTRPAPQQTGVQTRERVRQSRQPEYEPEVDKEEEEIEVPVKKKHKKKIWVVLLLVLIAGIVAWLLLAKQPINKETGLGARKPGISTILLVGTDEGGTRTDTMMLLSVNNKEKTASLISIPRDTMVNGPYNPPKINSVYGANKGDERIDMLMQRVGECIGFEPDGYLVVNLDSFVDLVDTMGGVKFNVPMDMQYSDPAQGLTIDLKAGEQKLDGYQAMGLVRFRSGYAAADLERVNVQRAFVSAAAKQWMKPTVIFKAPRLLAWFGKNVETNLSTSNMTWLAMALLRADKDAIETQTLPGDASYIGGVSYYVLNPYNVAEAVNAYCNPYEADITVDNLKIRG